MTNAYQNAQSDGKVINMKDQESALMNTPPGNLCPSVLCFDKCDHGITFGASSVSQTNPLAKVDIPGAHWPIAPFPQYKYPLEENIFHNKCQDETCLAEIEDLIFRAEDTGLQGYNYISHKLL